MKIIVTGLIGSIPIAGLTLHYLQYVLGLREMGHDILYLEDTGSLCYDPVSDSMVVNSSAGIDYLASVMTSYDLSEQWCFIDHEGEVFGISRHKLDKFVKSTDLFLNVTGAGLIRDRYLQIDCRVYIDTDPGFIHMRIASGSEKDDSHLQRHTNYFSFGYNIGQPDCGIPIGNYAWQPTVQPIVANLWPSSKAPASAAFTTIMKWKSYSPEQYKGETYGLKDMELTKFIDLPTRIHRSMELAIAGTPPHKELARGGWQTRQAFGISRSIEDYRAYIQASRGEWSVAKNAYVKLNTGWFSERSACYLASGRPVIVQETGFSKWMNNQGLGVVSFSTFEEAVIGLEGVEQNYDRHVRAAKEIASEYFSATKVLTALIERALTSI